MKITIHQPDYLPWIGFFHRWFSSDLLIIYDDAQFIKGGWQNRDKILLGSNEYWLSVPVLTKKKLGQLIKDVQINYDVKWQIKHIKTLKNYYGNSKNFSDIINIIEEAYSKKHIYLIELNLFLMENIGKYLGIKTPIKFSSNYNLKSKNTDKIIDLINAENGTTYLTGTGSKEYLNESMIKQNNIHLNYQEHDDLKKYIDSENIYLSIIHYLFRNEIKQF